MQVKSDVFAAAAQNYEGSNIPYTKLDCQAFVKQVLKDCGAYSKNYIGSNDMWRNMAINKIDLATQRNKLKPGMLLFTIKYDGKEPYYYKDGVNAAHVGIYTGMGKGAMHSSTGGVQSISSDDKRWTHAAEAREVDYSVTPDIVPIGDVKDAINLLQRAIKILEEMQ